MRVLAIDTSGAISAVAVMDGESVLAEDDSDGGERHGTLLLPRIAAQLEAAGLTLSAIELIAVGLGPGSFTGLRVGLSTAKGLALALRVPIRGVSSLEVLARGVLERAEVAVPLLDAGRGELFVAAYARASTGQALPAQVLAPVRGEASAVVAMLGELARNRGALAVCGSGALAHAAALASELGPRLVPVEPREHAPRAGHVARAALAWLQAEGASDLAALEPAYLRDSDAKLPNEPLAV